MPSPESLLRKVEDEIEPRRAIANRLKRSARGRYTTGSEKELADQTRTDIRLHNPQVEARVPIEIKIAGKWSAADLRERLENQLVRQYMREAQYGVFLVVNRGTEGDRGKWKLDRGYVTFGELIAWLTREARGVNANVAVIGIDLLMRDRTSKTQRSGAKNSTKPPKTARRRV